MRLRRDPDGQSAGHSKRAATAGEKNQQFPAGNAGGATKPQPPVKELNQEEGGVPQRGRAWLGFALLSTAAFICYTPCLNGQFVWDDDAWTLHLEQILR